MTNGRTVGIVHVHSDYSHDGRDSLEVLQLFAAKRGIAFVGLTEHAEDFDAARFDRYREHCRRASVGGVRLLPGLEFRFEGFPGLHLLVLGLGAWIEPRTPEELVAIVPRASGFSILAHPRLARYRVPDAVAAAIDGIEVWNAAYDTRYLPDPQAIRLLRRLQGKYPRLVGVAGLDQHDAGNDRGTRVVLRTPGPDPLVELRAGRFDNVGRTMRFGARVDWSRWSLGGLVVVRTLFDVAERTQDRLARRAAARRQP
ncbi:MAG: PHP domain-containing protein [Gemmatimonadales bacterium]